MRLKTEEAYYHKGEYASFGYYTKNFSISSHTASV